MRTDFLVHWTGKDIERDRGQLDEPKRASYVDRLVDIVNNGFWMGGVKEKLGGAGEASLIYEAPVTCFTEIRLSAAKEHSKLYGLLGIAVGRRFVLERFGGPVFYVRNHDTETIVANARAIYGVLERATESGPGKVKDATISHLAILVAYMKGMSNPGTDDFESLDEQEWRIVQTMEQVKKGSIVETGIERPQYRIPLKAGDIQAVVFPDAETRHLALSRGGGLEVLKGVPMPTVRECEMF